MKRETSSKTAQPTAQASQAPIKRGRGRPRKERTPEELAKIEKRKQHKMSLAERQALKLKAQKEKEAAKHGCEPANKDRFYCTSKDLLSELEKWRDSNKAAESKLKDKSKIDYTERKISNELGEMLLAIGNKLLNHSSFRNYPKDLKEDMLMFGVEKIIRGLKNYNFEFNNSFAYCTQAFWNAYLTIINKHYKQINIRRDLMKKLSSEIETYNGMSSSSALNKCIKAYLGNDIDLD